MVIFFRVGYMSTSLHWEGSSFVVRMSRLNLVLHVISLDEYSTWC